MSERIDVLIVEDSPDDAELVLRALRQGDFAPDAVRVETADELRGALGERSWQLAIIDHNLPAFSGPEALALLAAEAPAIPAIVVSGAIGEDVAVETMRAGAHDYVLKNNLTRLAPAARRALHEAAERLALQRADTAAAQSEARFRALFEGAADGIVVARPDGTILDANDTACRLHGEALDDLVGANLLTRIVAAGGGASSPSILIPGLGTGEDVVFEALALHESGSTTPVEVSARTVLHEGEAAVLAIVRDISERHEAERRLIESAERLRAVVDGAVEAMGTVVEARDRFTAGHQKRVTRLALLIAAAMGATADQVQGIAVAGLVHDIGKIAVPTEILNRPARLNETEFGFVKMHCEAGRDILKSIAFEWPVAEIVAQHHERLDGSGYPLGLRGEDMLLEARIIAVADVVEAMVSHRPWRAALAVDTALDEIRAGAGAVYDAGAVAATVELFAGGFTFES